MAEILKEWLTERLQRPIKWEAEEFGNMMKDGSVIAGVLLSYHVINEEKHYLIRPSNRIQDIKNNWRYLTEWLRDLEINLTDQDLGSLMEGRGSSLLRLFYQLFLHLDKRDRINFIKRERKNISSIVEKMENRFKVEKVHEEQEPFVDNLSKPLLDEKQFIDWQKKKAAQVKDTYDYIRHKYSKMLAKIDESDIPMQFKVSKPEKYSGIEKKEMDKFALRYPCEFVNYRYEQLLDLEENAAVRKKSLVDTEWAKNYMDNLHTKMHKKSDSEEFQKQIRSALSGSLWDRSVGEEENKLDIDLAKKVMKLSQFEKQMCTQIMETRQQSRNLYKNRMQAEKEFVDQRRQQFDQFLDNVKEQITLEVSEADFEKHRQNMLHRKLYEEKIKRKRKHYYEICYDTVLSIVDFVSKYAHYKCLIGGEIPDHFIHEWKTLYFKRQAIFDILDPMENILKDDDEDKPIKEEEIIRLELDRQEILNENEFQEYHNYSYPWNLDSLIPNYDPNSDERKFEYLGARILGHLVYTLLEIKYPYPPSRQPVNLPSFSSKCLIRGLPDKAITTAMQTLLNLRKIRVVRLETAINYCLRKFKTEMLGCTDIELLYDKFIASAQDENSRELIKQIRTEDESLSKISEANLAAMLGVIPPNAKQTQTPKTIPEDEISLSCAAELGRYVYQALNFGDSLTDHLLSAMIIEYLKDQGDINGFAIINYPNSYREAQILEETFSGHQPPDEELLSDSDDIYLEENIMKHRKIEKDQYKEVRISKIVKDPHKKRIEKPFESYFTCYINLKETDDILQEFVIWDLNKENSDLLDRFYAILGINYSMYFEVMDKDFLAQICKYIIGEPLTPLPCDSLFGENVLSLLDFPNSEDKRIKSKTVKPEVTNDKSKERLRRGSKTSKSSNNGSNFIKAIISQEMPIETIVILEEEKKGINEDVEEEDTELNITESIESVKLLAGEEDWGYGEIPISDIIGVALASCWEEVENNYVNDMQHLFFAKRLQMNCLIPYARFVKDKMEQIITLPSLKQNLVSKFQQEYNNFENDWRDVNLTKNEWHCRVKELQHHLYRICDERKLYAGQQRQSLINENWTMDELTTMVNTYISCMQTELNRSILTFQALHDFFFAMIKRMPSNDRLSSKELTKIFRETEETSGSRKGGEDKVYRQLKTAFLDLQSKNIEIDVKNNPFNLIIENNVKFALRVIKETNDSYRSLISKEYSEIAKIVMPVKKKDENTSEESVNAEEIFKENALKCIEEWSMGVNGEMFRASLRIMALQYMCYKNMKLFSDHIFKTFKEIQDDINSYYLNEIKSVDRLCKYLQIAVEGGRKIPESLILENDTFVIDPNLLQYIKSETYVNMPDISEISQIFEFKVSQLARLRSQFKIVSPTGIALQQAFIYLLQDFLFFGKDTCEGPLFPEIWNKVDPEQVPKLVLLIFGETVFVDWRDFLIYCLNIPFPSVDELLEIRRKFRCVDIDSAELITRNDFLKEKFWFDEVFDIDDIYSQSRKNLVKNFLFDLYETEEDMMNYSAFLLAFCKNPDPITGFVSALSMAVGKKTCFNLEECEDVVSNLIKDKKYHDECLACAKKCTQLFIDKLIVNVVNACEGVTISELEYIEPQPDDIKVKKGKSSKVKKTENLNTRLTKPQKNLTSCSKQESAIDVKTTFICKPCEEETEIVEEKPPEKEEVEEEHVNELQQQDPNLAYSVSQSVIWNVLRICLPWHFHLLPEQNTNPYVEQVTTLMKTLENDTDNGDIFVCKFVSDPNVCKLLHKVKKFTTLNLVEEIQKVFL